MIDVTRLPTIQEIRPNSYYLDFYFKDTFILTVHNNIELSNVLLWCAAKHYTSYDEDRQNSEFTHEDVYFISNDDVKYTVASNFKHLNTEISDSKMFKTQVHLMIAFQINDIQNIFEDGDDINLNNLRYEK